jgi:hypothetical protein
MWRNVVRSRACGSLLTALVTGLALLLALAAMSGGAAAFDLGLTPTAHAYLPYVARGHIAATPTPTPTRTPECPTTSTHTYSTGTAYQFDTDNPVRRAWNHADKNLHLRWFSLNTNPGLVRELVNYGNDDPTQPPQFATLFNPSRVPPLINFYRVYDWIWRPSPDPGYRGSPITTWPVTAMGLGTTPGEALRVPASGYDIGGGMEVLVLYADPDTLALRYTREDSSGASGYTVHLQNICTDPNLLALYNQTDADPGPRYIYPNHSYPLVNMPAGWHIGWTRGYETIVAIVDSGTFMDTRSCNEWWQIRPGYTGSCPPAKQ